MGAFYACFRGFLVLTRVFRLQMRAGGKRDDKDSSESGGECGGGRGRPGVDIQRGRHGIKRRGC